MTAPATLAPNVMTDAQLLASSLHSQTCKNHGYNGDCTWAVEAVDEELDTWECFAHAPFLKTAQKMLELTDVETALKMVSLTLENR